MLEKGTYHDLEKLEQFTEGDEELQSAIVHSFVAEAPKLILQLKAAFERGDLNSMGRFAHSFKPNAELFGISSIHNEILYIEQCGRDRVKSTDLGELIDRVDQIVQCVVQELT